MRWMFFLADSSKLQSAETEHKWECVLLPQGLGWTVKTVLHTKPSAHVLYVHKSNPRGIVY